MTAGCGAVPVDVRDTGVGEIPETVFVDETCSTNDDVRALALAGAPEGTAVAARRQTGGRGRRGHVWDSPEGGLYLSVLLRPGVSTGMYVGLPAVCALGVRDALRDIVGKPVVKLKWPNDILLVGRDAGGPEPADGTGDAAGKLAGILVEAGSGERGRHAVCGVGVNLRGFAGGSADLSDTASLPGSLPPVSLERAMGDDVPSFEAVAYAVRDGILRALDGWRRSIGEGCGVDGPLSPVLDDYNAGLYLLGEQVDVVGLDGAAVAWGTFAGVDPWGRAVVAADGGKRAAYACEQVSLRRRGWLRP